MSATNTQPPSIRELARRVLARNRQRNHDATCTKKERNFQAILDPQKLRSKYDADGKIIPFPGERIKRLWPMAENSPVWPEWGKVRCCVCEHYQDGCTQGLDASEPEKARYCYSYQLKGDNHG